jgi:hypothetical protein
MLSARLLGSPSLAEFVPLTRTESGNLSINGSTALCWALAARAFQFRNLFYTVGGTPWTGDEPVARPLPTRRTT